MSTRPLRTSVPMTSQGSAYGRLRRALDRRNTLAALSAAAELPHVGLNDALELLLLVAGEGLPIPLAPKPGRLPLLYGLPQPTS